MRRHLGSFREVLRDEGPLSRRTAARTLILVTFLVVPLLLVGLFWALHVGNVNRGNQRAIQDANCRAYVALRVQIVESTESVSQKELERLGLGQLSAVAVNQATAERREKRLGKLGPAPPYCR